MGLKQKILKWLDIPVMPKQRDFTEEFKKASNEIADRLDRSFTQRIARFSAVNCIVCGKGLVEGRDGMYRNSKGQIFCSHEHIDEYKESI